MGGETEGFVLFCFVLPLSLFTSGEVRFAFLENRSVEMTAGAVVGVGSREVKAVC